MSASTTQWALERALLEAISSEWRAQNANRFRGVLTGPSFRLDDSEHRLAGWVRGPREIVVSRRLIRSAPWGSVVEVLKHEMAHQFAHEVLGAVDETAHGRAFQDTCARFGIDAAAAGLPSASGAAPVADERIMRRITRLLALAESPNVHEAQSAMAAAQALLLRYNLDRVAERPSYVWRHLGTPALRLQAADRWVCAILLKHFFVEGIWVTVYLPDVGKRATVLEVCGTAENVEMAAYVHAFLSRTAEDLWQRHVRSSGAPRGGRRAYAAGMMRGFLERLDEQARVQKEEGLVWLGDPRNRAFFRQRYPRIATVRRRGPARTEAWDEGRAAGREIVLHKPVTGEAGNRGRLLG